MSNRRLCRVIWCALFLSCVARLVAAAPTEDAIVTITAQVGPDWFFGSGALVSADGEILTCYHVVQGAHRILVFLRGTREGTSNVKIEKILPNYDLAVIKVLGIAGPTPYVRIAPRLPLHLFGQDFHVYGYMAGLDRQKLLARATQDGLALSGPLNTPGKNPRPLFKASDVQLLPLNLTIYHGLSGGPVVSNDGIIGVISGALSEGGAFAWAIPASYLSAADVKIIDKPPQDVVWPPLTLMAEDWTNMRGVLRSGGPVMEAAKKYLDSMDSAQAAYRDLEASVTREGAILGRVITELDELPVEDRNRTLQDVSNDPRFKDWAANVRDTVGKFQPASQEFSQCMQKWMQAGRQVGENLKQLRNEAEQYSKTVPKTPSNVELTNSIMEDFRLRSEHYATLGQSINLPPIHAAGSYIISEQREAFASLKNVADALSSSEIKDKIARFFMEVRNVAIPLEQVLELNPR